MLFYSFKVIINLFLLLNVVQCYLPCKAGVNVKHGQLLDCATRAGYEYALIKCDFGYEFETDILEKEIFLDPQDDYLIDPIQCNAIGCPLKYIPKEEDLLESDPMTITKSICVHASLEGHCVPEVSYIDFKCNTGYIVDSDYGTLRAKCLHSYLWDPIPVCMKDFKDPFWATTTTNTAKNKPTTTPTTTSTTTPTTTTTSTTTPTTTTTSTTTPTTTTTSTTTLTTTTISTTTTTPTTTSTTTTTVTTPKPTSITTSRFMNTVPLCWRNLPKRPLNGEGSIVNFSCNPYYYLVGRSELSCVNGEWETDIPICIITSNHCRIKPSMDIGKSRLIGIKSIIVKNEIAYHYQTEDIRFYTLAKYTCPNNRFKLNQNKTIMYKTIHDRKVGYVELACLGNEEWEEVKCDD